MVSGRDILKMTKVNGVCDFEGHNLDGALDVEHCINSFGSQFYGDTVHRDREAANKDDMGQAGKAHLQGQEAASATSYWLCHLPKQCHQLGTKCSNM